MPFNEFEFETIFREGHPLDIRGMETGFHTPAGNPGITTLLGNTQRLRRVLISDPDLISDIDDIEGLNRQNRGIASLARKGLF